MSSFQIHPQGWVSILVTPKYEEQAKEMRAERDLQYRNTYTETETDERWVGDLGEMVFNSWLEQEHVQGFKWVLDDTAGKPDFVTASNKRIGVKTVKRKVPPRKSYGAQVTAIHAHEPVDHFFFMSYEIAKRRMSLVGGIERARFLQKARYYGPGELVHKHYRIRKGHEIYNTEIEKLIPPKEWLKQVC